MPAVAGSFMKLFADSLSGKSVEELVAHRARETSPTWDPAEFVPVGGVEGRVPRRVRCSAAPGSVVDDWATSVRAFRVPVLLVCGGNEERGRIVPPSVAARAGELCPTLESVCLEQAGHNVRREAYDEYVAAVTAFLRRN